MARYLLDTNIVGNLVALPDGPAARTLAGVASKNLCTSIVVAAELRYGAAKKGSTRLAARIEAALGALDVVPFQAPADTIYGALRAHLERRGRLIGANDLLIAAHALALGCTIVTDNVREFARVEGLAVENWLR